MEAASSPGSGAEAGQGWTEEQRAALQTAFLMVKPSQRNFWQHVAKRVPGKSALECCNCKFDELPTPVEKGRAGLQPGASPIQAPAFKLAAGALLATPWTAMLFHVTLAQKQLLVFAASAPLVGRWTIVTGLTS